MAKELDKKQKKSVSGGKMNKPSAVRAKILYEGDNPKVNPLDFVIEKSVKEKFCYVPLDPEEDKNY